MNEIQIKINETQYTLKQSFRSLMMLEKHIGKSVYQMEDNLNNTILLFYYMLQSANKDTFKFTLDEFIDLLDNNSNTIEVFQEFMQSQIPVDNKKKEKKQK